MLKQRRITALDAVTATTTSSKFWVGGAARVGIMFRRANHSSGTTTVSAKVSLEPISAGSGIPDVFNNPTGGTGVTVTTYNRLLDNATTTAYVASKALAANGDGFVWLDMGAMVNWLEVTLTEGTDGTHSAWIIVEEED